ncbi:hypothetical protein A2U01_0063684, partial [Trifolium medium]|nr:hypothetical protein [Trifolium medium]
GIEPWSSLSSLTSITTGPTNDRLLPIAVAGDRIVIFPTKFNVNHH